MLPSEQPASVVAHTHTSVRPPTFSRQARPAPVESLSPVVVVDALCEDAEVRRAMEEHRKRAGSSPLSRATPAAPAVEMELQDYVLAAVAVPLLILPLSTAVGLTTLM